MIRRNASLHAQLDVLRRGRVLVAAGLVVIALACRISANDFIAGGMTWMTQFPPTWNAMAPKVVSDGLHAYAVLCGFNGSSHVCSVVRKRGIETWTQGFATFTASQPPVATLDRKGRLNVFFNDPQLHHFRFDHPSVELNAWTELPLPFGGQTAYLHASYDAPSDTILLAFADPATWTTYFGVKYAANDWVLAPMPAAPTGTLYLYARTLRAHDHFFVLVGEHPTGSPNANYTAAVLFESASPTGPWTMRELHRVSGTNLGVPYENWTYPLDLQADAVGNVRALIQADESMSGHVPLAEGIHIAREEDGYALRHVASDIDDGFILQVDPLSNTHYAFALIRSSSLSSNAGHLVAFRSDDDGVLWTGGERVVEDPACNPVAIEPRNGSMLGGKDLMFIYSANVIAPFDRVLSAALQLPIGNSGDRYDYWYTPSDGTWHYVRAYKERNSGRSYYYYYDYATDGSYSLAYSYTAGDYYQVYIADSNGGYRYYNSDGYEVTRSAPQIIQYSYIDSRDGTNDFIYIYKDQSESIYYWYIIDYDPTGNWTRTYVYYRGSYWQVKISHSDGHYTLTESTGMEQVG